MFFNQATFYLFKCNKCETILDIDLDETEDIDNYKENKLQVECSCGGSCSALRD